MLDKVIMAQVKLMRFAVIPGILGGIACFIGPQHSTLIKAAIGVVIGCVIQHCYMVKAVRTAIKDNEEFFEQFFEDEDE